MDLQELKQRLADLEQQLGQGARPAAGDRLARSPEMRL